MKRARRTRAMQQREGTTRNANEPSDLAVSFLTDGCVRRAHTLPILWESLLEENPTFGQSSSQIAGCRKFTYFFSALIYLWFLCKSAHSVPTRFVSSFLSRNIWLKLLSNEKFQWNKSVSLPWRGHCEPAINSFPAAEWINLHIDSLCYETQPWLQQMKTLPSKQQRTISAIPIQPVPARFHAQRQDNERWKFNRMPTNNRYDQWLSQCNHRYLKFPAIVTDDWIDHLGSPLALFSPWIIDSWSTFGPLYVKALSRLLICALRNARHVVFDPLEPAEFQRLPLSARRRNRRNPTDRPSSKSFLFLFSLPPLYRKFPDQQQQQAFNIPMVFTRKPFVTHRRSFSFAPQMALVFQLPKQSKSAS